MSEPDALVLEALVSVPRVALGVLLGAWWLLRSWRASRARATERRVFLETRTRYALAAHKNADETVVRVWTAIDAAVRDAAQLSDALHAVRDESHAVPLPQPQPQTPTQAATEDAAAEPAADTQAAAAAVSSAETRAALRVQHWRTLVEAALAHALTCATLTALVHVSVHVHVAALSRALYAAQGPALKPLLATLSDETLQRRFLSGATHVLTRCPDLVADMRRAVQAELATTELKAMLSGDAARDLLQRIELRWRSDGGLKSALAALQLPEEPVASAASALGAARAPPWTGAARVLALLRRDVLRAFASRECLACTLELVTLAHAQLRHALATTPAARSGAPVARLAPLLSNAAASMTREGELGATLAALRGSLRTQRWFDALFAEMADDDNDASA